MLINSYIHISQSYTTEYQAYLDEGTTQGYTLPSESVQITQNAIIAALISDGNYSKLQMLYIFTGDGSDDFKKINLINPTGTKITEVGGGALTWSSTGVLGDAVNHLDTGIVTASPYIQDSASIWLDIVTEFTVRNDMLRANFEGGSSLRLLNANTINRVNTTNTLINDLSGTGFFTISRNSSTNTEVWIDGVFNEVDTVLSTNSPDENLLMFRAGAFRGDMEIGILAIASDVDGEELNVYNAFNP